MSLKSNNSKMKTIKSKKLPGVISKQIQNLFKNNGICISGINSLILRFEVSRVLIVLFNSRHSGGILWIIPCFTSYGDQTLRRVVTEPSISVTASTLCIVGAVTDWLNLLRLLCKYSIELVLIRKIPKRNLLGITAGLRT